MASLYISHLRPPTVSQFFPPPSSPLPISNSSGGILSPSSNCPDQYCSKIPFLATTAFNVVAVGAHYRFSSGGNYTEEEDDDGAVTDEVGFKEAVAVFNGGDYYKCHDILEDLWNNAQDPARTLIHGILQCAVGFHHLFNQNHKGAMMELGEGLCKLRKMDFESGPFLQFEQEIAAVLEFIYQTQLELAACTDDFCIALDQSERSYQLLGGYAAGEQLYCLEGEPDQQTMFIIFRPERSFVVTGESPRVKLPTLYASEEHLNALDRL